MKTHLLLGLPLVLTPAALMAQTTETFTPPTATGWYRLRSMYSGPNTDRQQLCVTMPAVDPDDEDKPLIMTATAPVPYESQASATQFFRFEKNPDGSDTYAIRSFSDQKGYINPIPTAVAVNTGKWLYQSSPVPDDAPDPYQFILADTEVTDNGKNTFKLTTTQLAAENPAWYVTVGSGTSNMSLTLDDGQDDYGELVWELDQYPPSMLTGVGTVTAATPDGAEILYDITGRRVNVASAHGLFITSDRRLVMR